MYNRIVFSKQFGYAAGIRQFHFNAWKDPNGTLAAHPAGLKLAGVTNVTLDPKYTFFGKSYRQQAPWQNCVRKAAMSKPATTKAL